MVFIAYGMAASALWFTYDAAGNKSAVLSAQLSILDYLLSNFSIPLAV